MAGYETDFVLWTQEQAGTLRDAAQADSNLRVDWLNVAEEIQSLGNRDRRELRSRLTTLIEHLLKLAVYPEREPRQGWIDTVSRERQEIDYLFEDSPSLKKAVELLLSGASDRARERLLRLGANRTLVDAALAGELARQVFDQSFFPGPG